MLRLRNSPALAAAGDSLVALGLAVGAVAWARAASIPHGGLTEFVTIRVTLLNASFSIVFVVLWKQCLTAFGLYRGGVRGLRSLVLRSALACAAMTTLLGLYLEARHARGPQGKILLSFFAAAFLFEICRGLFSGEGNWRIAEPERVIILGSDRLAGKAWRELRLQHHRSKRLLGFVDDRDPALMPPDIAGRHIATVDQLPAYLQQHAVDELIVSVPMRSCFEVAQRAVAMAEAAGVRVVCLNDMFALEQDKVLGRRSTLFLELSPKDRRRQPVVPEMLKRFDVAR